MTGAEYDIALKKAKHDLEKAAENQGEEANPRG
jgi:hypothetical protein